MKLGEASGQLDPEFNPFTDDYLGEMLKAVADAWARMKQPMRNEWEDHITFRIAGRLLNDPLFRDLPYEIVPQYWLLGMNGQRLGRLDLRFKHRYSQRDYFAFESKRLHVTYPGGRLSLDYYVYAGSEGMGGFIGGQYSTGLPSAGMIGYVMDGDTAKAWTGLATRIEAKRDELCLVVASNFIESLLKHHTDYALPGSRLGETQHNLGSHNLRLFHLLLPVKRCSLIQATDDGHDH
jgi:hypothetical protein